jgi:hypothetical protein
LEVKFRVLNTLRPMKSADFIGLREWCPGRESIKPADETNPPLLFGGGADDAVSGRHRIRETDLLDGLTDEPMSDVHALSSRCRQNIRVVGSAVFGSGTAIPTPILEPRPA